MERQPLRAFALLGEDHHDAVSRVRHLDAQMQIDVNAVLRLRDETAARLALTPGEIWRL